MRWNPAKREHIRAAMAGASGALATLIRGSPARSSATFSASVTVPDSVGSPSRFGKTSSPSARSRYCSSAVIASCGSSTQRRLVTDFGSTKTWPRPGWRCSARRTCSRPGEQVDIAPLESQGLTDP